jgi:hypothetical protein
MKRHDPYGPLLAELSDINDADTDELLRESLRQTQPYVKSLREAYRSSPSRVDYSCPHNRAAYLLAYYPHYIEALYHILCDSPQEIIMRFFSRQKLRACFFGSGPAPEAIGWIAYLNEHVPAAERAVAYLLDKHSSGWHKGQEITRYHLAPVYWPQGKLITVPLEFDFLDLPNSWDARVERAIQISDFFVMQNCLNDQLDLSDELLQNFLWIFQQIQSGSIFIIADLKFQNVLDLMVRIEKEVVSTELGVVVHSATQGIVEFQSQIEAPSIIYEELLTGEDNLIPRRYTRFYSSILVRHEESERGDSLDKIPF